MIGRTVGNYRLVEKIGIGGAGEVYRAVDLLLDRSVAVKALRAEVSNRPNLLERFRQEAQTLAKLNHPNIAILYALVEEGDAPLMVMEYVEGVTFAQIVKARGAMPIARALPLFFQALDGVGYAHERGIVHRDLKGANLMLGVDGTVKVMDFGIARALGSGRSTRHGHMVGTLGFMSPEQVQGRETDTRSDIYSLGVLLYDMLTGEMPFPQHSDYSLMRAHVESPPPPVREAAPDTPVELESILLRMLAKDPAERFETVAELREALEAVPGSADSVATGAIQALREASTRTPETADEITPHTEQRAAYVPADDAREAPTIESPHASDPSTTADSSPAPRAWLWPFGLRGQRAVASAALVTLVIGVDWIAPVAEPAVVAPKTPEMPAVAADSSSVPAPSVALEFEFPDLELQGTLAVLDSAASPAVGPLAEPATPAAKPRGEVIAKPAPAPRRAKATPAAPAPQKTRKRAEAQPQGSEEWVIRR